MAKLICTVPCMAGTYGFVEMGDVFEAESVTAQQLIQAGKAESWTDPEPIQARVLTFETQTPSFETHTPQVETSILARETKEADRQANGDLPVPDEGPAGVAAHDDRVIPGAEVPESGTTNSRGRKKRQ